MKRKILACLTAVSILAAGCRPAVEETDAKLETYEMYYNSIVFNSQFTQESEYYSIATEMVKVDASSYRYYVFFDEPQVAMYDIIILGIENDRPYGVDKMMPSIGIFDSHYSMIPYQVNLEEGFIKGIVISGESDSPELSLKVIVEWKDHNRANTYREFHLLNIRYVESPLPPSAQEELPLEEEQNPGEGGE